MLHAHKVILLTIKHDFHLIPSLSTVYTLPVHESIHDMSAQTTTCSGKL